MKLVTLKTAVTFDEHVIPANECCIWSNGFAEGFRQSAAQFITSFETLNGAYRQYRGQSLRGKSLLLWRTGGFGDLLFLTPLLRELKRRWPDCHLTVACRPKYHMVFRNNPDVDQLLALPVPLRVLHTHDYHLHFEGTIEKSTDANTHAVDLFARHAGLKIKDRTVTYSLTAAERRIGQDTVRKLDPQGRFRHVAIHVRASSPVRTYPWKQLEQVVRGLVERRCQVYLLGGFGEGGQVRVPGVFNFCGAFPEMTSTVSLLAACDLLIAPDSSLTHFAGALDVPTIALYGPFPARVRTRFYPHCLALEPDYPCAPCFTHGHMPCREAQKRGRADSPCFNQLPPERILAEVDTFFSKKEENNPCSR